MKIKDREIMKQLKINLDLDMLIIHILKNMALGIIEEEEDSPLEKLHVEWLLEQSQK